MEGADALNLDDLTDNPDERARQHVLLIVPSYTATSVVSCVGCLKSIRNTEHRCASRNLSENILAKFKLLEFRDWITPKHSEMFDYVRRVNVDNLINQNRWVGTMFLDHVRLKHRIRIPVPEYGPVEFATRQSQNTIGQTVTFVKNEPIDRYVVVVDTNDSERRFWIHSGIDDACESMNESIDFDPSWWRPLYTVDDFKNRKPIKVLLTNNL